MLKISLHFPPTALLLGLAFCTAGSLAAQNPTNQQTIVVLGTAEPAPLAESTREIELIPAAASSSIATPESLLRNSASLFIEQRGDGGAQADISIRGGGFEDTLILLNGFRVNDAQTGHHNLDLPLPISAIDHIELLSGTGSTLHGADALSGIVDFLTSAPTHSHLTLRSGGGSNTRFENALLADWSRKHLSAKLSAELNGSSGFIADRDYHSANAMLETWLDSTLGTSDWMLAASNRNFGADQFYGNYPSWERTKGWFTALRQSLPQNWWIDTSWRRHSDEFILIRKAPSIYENNHIDDSWQAEIRHTKTFNGNLVLLAGLNADGDQIASNNLGHHGRNRGSGYLDIDWKPRNSHWTASAGLREELYAGSASGFSPQLAASYRLTPQFKLRAAEGHGFRMPSYTELYYSDPTTLGDSNLKPEQAWEAEAGIDWSLRRLTAHATGYVRTLHNAIDYERASNSAPWQATNISNLRFSGFEGSAEIQINSRQQLNLNLTTTRGNQILTSRIQSEYVFNYPAERARASWQIRLPDSWQAQTAVEVVRRFANAPYPVWTLEASRNRGHFAPYLRLENISNTGYTEVINVRMPPRGFVAGLTLHIAH